MGGSGKSGGRNTPVSGSTVRGVHIMLHSALDRAVKERLLIRNLADNRVVPKVQHQEMKTLQPEDLKAYLGCNKTAERPGYVLSGVGQRLPQGRIGGPPMGEPGHEATNHLCQQIGCEGQGQQADRCPPQDREFHPADTHFPGSCGASGVIRTPDLLITKPIPASSHCSTRASRRFSPKISRSGNFFGIPPPNDFLHRSTI